MAIAAALAPSDPRKGPLMLAPPSYVMSASRLTIPIVNTNRNAADEAPRIIAGYSGSSSGRIRAGRPSPAAGDEQVHKSEPHRKVRARFVQHAPPAVRVELWQLKTPESSTEQ